MIRIPAAFLGCAEYNIPGFCLLLVSCGRSRFLQFQRNAFINARQETDQFRIIRTDLETGVIPHRICFNDGNMAVFFCSILCFRSFSCHRFLIQLKHSSGQWILSIRLINGQYPVFRSNFCYEFIMNCQFNIVLCGNHRISRTVAGDIPGCWHFFNTIIVRLTALIQDVQIFNQFCPVFSPFQR